MLISKHHKEFEYNIICDFNLFYLSTSHFTYFSLLAFSIVSHFFGFHFCSLLPVVQYGTAYLYRWIGFLTRLCFVGTPARNSVWILIVLRASMHSACDPFEQVNSYIFSKKYSDVTSTVYFNLRYRTVPYLRNSEYSQ